MDTKLKDNNERIGRILVILLIMLITASALLTYKPIYQYSRGLYLQMKEREEQNADEREIDNKKKLIRNLYMGNYSLYVETKQSSKLANYTATDILITKTIDDSSEGEFDYQDEENLVNLFDSYLEDWSQQFHNDIVYRHDLQYYVIDDATGITFTNSVTPSDLLSGYHGDMDRMKELFPFYMVFHYTKEGTLEMPVLHGLEEEWINDYRALESSKELFLEYLNESFSNQWQQIVRKIKAPSDITFIYASKSENFINVYMTGGYDYGYQLDAFGYGGFFYVFLIAMLLTVLMALLLPFRKSWKLGTGLSSRIPGELAIAGGMISIFSYNLILQLALDTASGTLMNGSAFSAIPLNKDVLMYGFNFLLWIAILGIGFLSVLSLRQLFTLGLKHYLKEKTLTGRLTLWLIRKAKKLLVSLGEIDFTDPSNKAILKILGVNFVILMLLCSIWIFGIFVLAIYTVILFFILRKYYADIRKKYMILLEATNRMANGKLEVSIDGNLGIFEPLKEELSRVQYGFRKAVEEEVKSQNMKTELITNVSHDLKTPLTSIITYVNLLKDANITEEERASYIDILDKKSLRLKRLIEDLFDISKANSNNVTLNKVDMDLVSLIKQVLLELDDTISKAEIEIRHNLPEGKVNLALDSEKTYRIFENLISNVANYSLPRSRAYIDMEKTSDTVTVTIKNVSAQELDFNPDDITDRFVRGDKSRNTEGSGLGLAIVKSFVELQGGHFHIVTDGDLFKAIIEWRKDS